MQVCFYAGQKYCIRKIMYISLKRKGTPLCGNCSSALFGIKFGTRVFPTLSREWLLHPRRDWLNQAHFREEKSMLATPLQPSQWLSVPTGCLPLELRLKTVIKVFSFFGVPESHYPSGTKSWRWSTKSHYPSRDIHPDWSSGPRFSDVGVHWSFLHTLRWFVTVSKDGCSFSRALGRQ